MWSENLKRLAYLTHPREKMMLHARTSRARHLLNLETTSLCAMIRRLHEIQSC